MNRLILAGLAAAASFAAIAATLAPDAPLIVDGPLAIDAGDVQGYLLKVPADKRVDFLTDYDRVAGVADALFIQRALASKAKAEGLDKDPVVQRRLRQSQEAVLADLYVEKLTKEPLKVNLERRAEEIYKSEPERFKTPELVATQQILVGPKWRTREMALARANEVYELAKSGKEDFLTLAGRYSDDPSLNKNGGDLGFSSPNSFVPSVRDAIAKMKAKGEIVGPIESEYGFHIIRLVERKLPETIPFAAVKNKLIVAERQRLEGARVDDALKVIRSSPTVVTHRDNVEALVVKVDPDLIKKALEKTQSQAAAK